jgi:quinol monooxygenase YgiN
MVLLRFGMDDRPLGDFCDSLRTMPTGFHVTISFEAAPGKAGELASILNDLVEPSRAEPGCLYYQPFTDVENPEKLVVIEAWERREQWQAHLASLHVVQALALIEKQALLTKPFSAQQLRSLG